MTMSYTRIDPLLEDIEAQRQVVDANLTRPARWRGPLRREGRRGPQPRDRTRYARAFNWLARQVASGATPDLDPALLRKLHALINGGDGGYRTREVRVGGFATAARASAVAGLVEQALARAADGSEEPPLAAARLHMELLLVHPWRDGNGRTVRMAAALMLMRHGFKSTLFTAVEQHTTAMPGAYSRAFDVLRSSRPTQHEPWLASHLQLMAWNSEFAAAYRLRENAMREALTAAGIEPGLHDDAMITHDRGESRAGAGGEVLQRNFPAWVDLSSRMHPDKRAAFAWQVERLVAEESG